MSGELSLIWSSLLTAGPLIGGVTLFAVQILQIRNLQNQNAKLQEEIEKLKQERQKRQSTLDVATFDQTLKYGKQFSRGSNTPIISIALIIGILGFYGLQVSYITGAQNQLSNMSRVSTSFEEQKQENKRLAARIQEFEKRLGREQTDINTENERLKERVRELEERLKLEQTETEKHLGKGDVRVVLKWDSGADLGLYVIDPLGEVISYKTQPLRNGKLDRDKQKGFRTESIFWPQHAAPKGWYRVYVKLYAGGHSYFTYSTTYFTVDVTYGASRSNFKGIITFLDQISYSKKFVTEFVVE